MNSMKIVRAEGHLSLLTSPAFPNAGANVIATRFSHYACGLFVDQDEVTAGGTNTMKPLENAQTTRWMWWRTGTLQSYVQGGSAQNLALDMCNARDKWAMIATRRYTRRYDAGNDTLTLAVQNSANSNDPIGVQFIMRVLVAER